MQIRSRSEGVLHPGPDADQAHGENKQRGRGLGNVVVLAAAVRATAKSETAEVAAVGIEVAPVGAIV